MAATNKKAKNSECKVVQMHLAEASVVVKAYLAAVHEVSESDARVTVELLRQRVVLEPNPMEVFRLLAFCKLLVKI